MMFHEETATAKTPRVDRLVSHSGSGEWCHPGDDNRQRWLLIFEDKDKGMNIYDTEQEAREAFYKAETLGWNCHLFSSVRRMATAND